MSNGLDRLRALVVDERRHLKQVLAPILNGASLTRIDYASGRGEALGRLGLDGPHLAFIDIDSSPDEMLNLVRTIRRPTVDWNYKLPVIVLVGSLSHAQICAVRDAGVNEILIKPITIATVMDRLSRVVLKPRPFVVSERYRGPDRRRRAMAAYPGTERRRADAR
jgi:two-component system chemotaxis response regulator CheY